jgi:dCTP deaminase
VLASDRDIQRLIANGDITITPPPSARQFQPASLDVHLDRFFRVPAKTVKVVDPAQEQELFEVIEMKDDQPYTIPYPGFALASTLEKVALGRGVAAQVDGRSSIGRLGLLVHATAGWIDPGFSGHVTLELVNLFGKPIKLYPGMEVGQLIFSILNTAAEVPYGDPARQSSYQGQPRGPVPSAIARNFNRVSTYTIGITK